MLQNQLKKISGEIVDFQLNDYFPDIGFLRSSDFISDKEKQKARSKGLLAAEEGVPPLSAVLYMEFRRKGNRNNFESNYYRRRMLLGRMLKAWCFGEESSGLLDGIINMLCAICDEWTWVIPAHNWPNDDTGQALPPVHPPRVDLMAGNTATLMALTVYYLRTALTSEAGRLIERVEYECRRRCITPYLENDDHWWMGYLDHPEHGELNNWTPWITDNFLHTLLLLRPEQDELQAAASRAAEILNHYLDVLPSDGGCDEGASYWDHAVGSLFGCLDVLDVLSGGVLDLRDDSYLKKAAAYITAVHIQDSYYANYADCPGVLEHMPGGLMFRMGQILEDEKLCRLAVDLHTREIDTSGYEEAFSVHRDFRNYLYPIKAFGNQRNTPSPGTLAPAVGFPETQVFLYKTETLFFSCKGGHNGESHNHNDIGQFVLYWKGQPAVIDPGVGEYTRDTFNHRRYTIWTMQSGWHNLPVINGMEQKEGQEFCSSSFESCDKLCSLGIESAYPESSGVKSWMRRFEIVEEELLLTDSWDLSREENSVVWHFICLEKPVLSEGRVTIPLDEGHLIISYPDQDLRGSLDYQEVPENDSKMGAWGKARIWRISLENKQNIPPQGKIQFKLKGN